jgi:FtsP/CotA-like multicopper oxidase with cupredoxin domain
MSHPFHLHGHQFAVIEMGSFNDTFTETELRENDVKVHLRKNPVYKDTISVPKKGYVRLRFRTPSANFLFFHCHYDFHLQIGMAGVLQVGEMSAMPKPPKDFPQCRDFIPK